MLSAENFTQTANLFIYLFEAANILFIYLFIYLKLIYLFIWANSADSK